MAQNDSVLHLNVPLTDLAVAFRPDEEGWLWSKLLPPKVVQNTSNIIRSVDRGALMSIPDMRAGAQGHSTEVQFRIGSQQTYSCIDYSVEVVKDRRERANADAILQYDDEMLYTGMTKVNNMLEKVSVKDTLRLAANYDAAQQLALTGGDRWDAYQSPNSDPISDLKSAILQVKIQTGGAKRGKIQVVMHELVWNAIQLHPNILARAPVHPTGGGILTLDVFEQILFGRPSERGAVKGEVVLTSSFYNTSLEPQAEDMRSFIGPDVLVIYSEPASTRAFGFGQAFMFAGVDDGIEFFDKAGGLPLVVYSYPDPKRGSYGSDVDRIVGSVDFKVLNPKGGFLLSTVVDATNTALYQNLLNN